MKVSEAIKWYSRKDVAAEIIRVCQDREVGVQYQDGHFGKRPGILQFPAELASLARNGATSFHMSQEHWSDPMRLTSEISEREMEEMRIGWDFIIDIDCPWFDYSTIAAEVVIEALRFHGINNPCVKFSGGRGWHIGIPFESLPQKLGKRSVEDLYPAATITIISYLKEFIGEILFERIKEHEGDIRKIVEKTGRAHSDFVKEGKPDVFKLLELDVQLGAPRHLIRTPYSLHEKEGNVSLVIKPEQIKEFKKEWARPKNVKEINDSFLNPELIEEGEAKQLLVQALDWKERQDKKEDARSKRTVEFTGDITKEMFPSCMKQILEGLSDGRKRALFALLNFLKCVNWDWDLIEQEVWAWNKRNKPPLKTGYIRTQLAWHKRQRQKIPPPNCGSFYDNFGVKCPPETKNPLTYVARMQRRARK